MEFSITLSIIILTVITSFSAFNNESIKNKALFYPYLLNQRKEYFRFITSGFIHADWLHLIVNMYVLYSFGTILETLLFPYYFETTSRLVFLFLYFGGMIISDIPSFLKHKKDPSYRSLGASGAVSAVVFSYILINPWEGGIGILFLPGLSIPPIIFGVLYLIYCIYMSRRGGDHINHDAHLYGAIFGFIFPGILKFEIFSIFIQQIAEKIG